MPWSHDQGESYDRPSGRPLFGRRQAPDGAIPFSIDIGAFQDLAEQAAPRTGETGDPLGPQPRGYPVKITATDGGTPPAYSWQRVDEDTEIPGVLNLKGAQGEPVQGGPGNFPAYELSGNPNVPLGIANVTLKPCLGAPAFWFEYQSGLTGPATITTELDDGSELNITSVVQAHKPTFDFTGSDLSLDFGANIQSVGLKNAAGVSQLACREDHVHAALASTVITELDDGSEINVTTTVAAHTPTFDFLGSDLRLNFGTNIQAVGSVSKAGVSEKVAREDHVHADVDPATILDHKVLVDGSDTTADYLNAKLAGTCPIATSVSGGGGNEQVTIKFDATCIAGYNASAVQLLGHDASGVLTWYNTASC